LPKSLGMILRKWNVLPNMTPHQRMHLAAILAATNHWNEWLWDATAGVRSCSVENFTITISFLMNLNTFHSLARVEAPRRTNEFDEIKSCYNGKRTTVDDIWIITRLLFRDVIVFPIYSQIMIQTIPFWTELQSFGTNPRLNVPIPIDMFNFMVCDTCNLNTTHCYSGVSEYLKCRQMTWENARNK
jgi:hypothetical protein